MGQALDALDATCGAAGPGFAGAAAPASPALRLDVSDDGRHCTLRFASADGAAAASHALSRFSDLTFSDGAFRGTYAPGRAIAFVPGPEEGGVRRGSLTLTEL